MTRADRHRRRNATALAASALVHVAVLGLLARYAPPFQPLWVAPRDFQIELVPPLLLAQPPGQARRPGAAAQTAPTVTPRIPKSAPRRTDVQTTTPYPLPTRGAAVQTPRPPSPLSRPLPPTPPANRIVLPGAEPFGAPSSASGWPAGAQGTTNGVETQTEGDGAGVRGALRTSVGCDDPDYYNLTKAELAKCHRDFGVQAAIGRRMYVDAIDSAKVRNEYDKAREACERLNHYATPLDSDRDHSASAPVGRLSETLGAAKLHC